MITNVAARSVVQKIARRGFAAAASHGHGSTPSKDVKQSHPLFCDHPKAPVVTYDDWPIPVVPYKEGYEKEQKTFNAMLAASFVVFLGMTIYVWKNDILNLRLTGRPKWYTHRVIGKGLGEGID